MDRVAFQIAEVGNPLCDRVAVPAVAASSSGVLFLETCRCVTDVMILHMPT